MCLIVTTPLKVGSGGTRLAELNSIIVTAAAWRLDLIIYMFSIEINDEGEGTDWV